MIQAPPEALRARVLERISSEPSFTRTQTRRRRALVIAIVLALAFIEFLLVGGMRDWGAPRSAGLILATASGLVLLAGAASYFALDRGEHMLGRPGPHLVAMLLVTPLVLFSWKVLWSSLFIGGLDPWPTRFGHKCMLLATTTGMTVGVGYLLTTRGTHTRPGLVAAAKGLAAGTIGAALVELWCPVGHPFHVFYGHVLPTLVVASLMALVGLALARWRR